VQTVGKVAQEIRALRAAPALTPERPLSQEQLARLLGVWWSTVARWETGGELGAQMEQKLLRLRRAVELLGHMVTPEHRVPFFEERHPMLLHRLLKNPFLCGPLKKVQMPGGARCEVRGVLRPYVAAPRERANAADGPFSAAC